jgi:hypothetical protein
MGAKVKVKEICGFIAYLRRTPKQLIAVGFFAPAIILGGPLR